MTKHQMPNDDRDRKNQSMPSDRQAGQRDTPSDDSQRMGSNENQQRQSPGRGDEGKGRDSGGDRR